MYLLVIHASLSPHESAFSTWHLHFHKTHGHDEHRHTIDRRNRPCPIKTAPLVLVMVMWARPNSNNMFHPYVFKTCFHWDLLLGHLWECSSYVLPIVFFSSELLLFLHGLVLLIIRTTDLWFASVNSCMWCVIAMIYYNKLFICLMARYQPNSWEMYCLSVGFWKYAKIC